MKTYRVSICQVTKKGKTNEVHALFVNSDANILDIVSAYKEKFQGFNIEVNEIKDIEIFKKDEKSTIINNENYWNNDSKYFASIYFKDIDIDGFDKVIEELKEKRDSLVEVEEKIKNLIIDRYNLNGVKNFSLKEHYVNFNFLSVFFKPKGK